MSNLPDMVYLWMVGGTLLGFVLGMTGIFIARLLGVER